MFETSRTRVFGVLLFPFLVAAPFGISLLSELQDFLIWVLQSLFETLYGFASMLTLELIEAVLFFPPPGDVPGLANMYYNVSLPLFVGLLGLMATYFFLMAELFPESSNASIDRFLLRVFIAVVLVLIVGEMFDYAVEVTNLMQGYLWPSQYRVAIDGSTMQALGSAALSGGGVIVFAFVASASLITTFLAFLVMLASRMVFIYMVYALFPFFIVLWIVDIGPATYTKMASGFAFKAAALLLLFGVLISAVLGVSGALISGTGAVGTATDAGTTTADIYISGGTVDRGTMETGVFADGSGVGAASTGSVNMAAAWFRVFVYFAALWLVISMTSMVLGVSASTGVTSMKMKISRFKQGARRGQSKASGSSGGMTGTSSGNEMTDTDSMDEPDMTETGSGQGTSGADAPENTEPASLREKADYASGGRLSDAKEKAGEMAERAEDGADKIAEKGSEAGDGVEKGAESVGESVGSAGGEYGAAAGKAVGKGVGKLGNVGVTAASYTPKAAMKGSKLAKRGGKAYGSVLKQPTMGESIGEAHRIAQDSPIANPNAGPSAGEKNLEDAVNNPVMANEMDGEYGETTEWSDADAGGGGSGGGGGGGGGDEEDDMLESGTSGEHVGSVESLDDLHEMDDGDRFDIEDATVVSAGSSTIERGGDSIDRQTATLEKGGEQFQAISFESSDYQTPDLQQGDTVSISNATKQNYNTDDPGAHPSARAQYGDNADYPQVKLTQNSSVSSTGGSSSNGGE